MRKIVIVRTTMMMLLLGAGILGSAHAQAGNATPIPSAACGRLTRVEIADGKIVSAAAMEAGRFTPPSAALAASWQHCPLSAV